MNVQLFSSITMKMLGITEELAATPEYSIVLDDYSGLHFPPTLLQVGTKEALLSDSVRMYSVLRQAGIEVEIDPHDAMIHCFHTIYQTREAKLLFKRAGQWFTKHMNLD
jgi:acetyl esterase/lipase